MNPHLRRQPGEPGTYRHAWMTCPACGKKVDSMSITDPGSGEPEDGDYVLCYGCHVVSVLVVGPFGMAFRTPDRAELDEFMRQHAHVLNDPGRYLT